MTTATARTDKRFNYVEPHRDDAMIALGKAIHDNLVKRLPAAVDAAFATKQRDADWTTAQFVQKRIDEAVDVRTKALEREVKELTATVESLAKSYEQGMQFIKHLLANAPVPVVNFHVPENAFKMLPSIVNLPANCIDVKMLPTIVNVPEGAINVRVDQQPSIVNMPENTINLTLPENAIRVNVDQPAPQITLPDGAIQVKVSHKSIMTQAPPREIKVRRKILYDHSTGRPSEIEETTTEQ